VVNGLDLPLVLFLSLFPVVGEELGKQAAGYEMGTGGKLTQ